MKKIITLALVISALTFVAHAQTNAQKEVKPAAQPTTTATNPLYNPSGTSGVNPMAQIQAPGSPIGGIVVATGHANLEQTGSSTTPAVSAAQPAIVVEQKTIAQPVNSKGHSEKGIK